MNNILQIVFSPTGGTQEVADAMTSEFKANIDKIDLTNSKLEYDTINLKEKDLAIIAFPSYGGRVPAIASERIKKIKGNNTNCVLVCVYGNRAYEDTLIEMKDIAEEQGFNVVAAVSAIAEHSIIHKFATGRPNENDKNELVNFMKKINDKINNNNFAHCTLSIPGNHPYKKSGGVGVVPKANNKCNNCGLCFQICPVQAISKENLKISDKKNCISCMRCVTKCPQHARNVNKLLVSVASMAIKKECSIIKQNELFI
ncbi:EFR1 family ferrodoxin [Intestinibacter sp.]